MSSSHLSLVGSHDPTPTPSIDPAGGNSRLATALTETASAMHATTGTDAVLAELVSAALGLVPGAQGASILVVRLEPVSRHATSPQVGEVDAHQLEVREGPGLEAAAHERAVRVLDLGQEARWTTFTPVARRLGVRSSLSLPLRVDRTVLGALNLYSRQVAAFDDESEQIGVLLTRHAAIALSHARSVDHLARAVTGRDIIGQAKGRLMERYDIDEDRAFAVLRRVSQGSHRKLHEVARELAVTGELTGAVQTEPEQTATTQAAPAQTELTAGPTGPP